MVRKISNDNRYRTVGLIVTASVSVLLVIMQVLLVTCFRYDEPEAVRQIQFATYTFDTGRFNVSAPWMSFIGYVARLFSIHPLKLIYSILPIVFIPAYYVCYYLLARRIFDSRIYRFYSIIIISGLNIWNYGSDNLLYYSILFSWFAGPVVIINAVCPIVLSMIIGRTPEVTEAIDERSVSDTDYEEEWDMKKHPFINARNLAIALAVVVAVLLGFVYFLNNKINSLYAVTVNLQSDIDSRCSIYPFVAHEGDDPTGYLLKDPDGRLVMFGGGGVDDTDEIYDFITRYGTEIESWYVYGDTDAERGAYDGCVEYKKDLVIKNVYTVVREESK